jgi:hypothetical protein
MFLKNQKISGQNHRYWEKVGLEFCHIGYTRAK